MRFEAGLVFASETTVRQSRQAAASHRGVSPGRPGARPVRMGVGSAPRRAKESRGGSQHRCRLKHITVLGNRGIKKSRFFPLPQSRPAVKAFCKRSPSSPTDTRCVVACGFLIAEAPSSLASLSSVCRLPLGSRSICSHDKTSSGLLGAEMRREPGPLVGPGRRVSRPGLTTRTSPRPPAPSPAGKHRAGGPPPERGVLVPRALIWGRSLQNLSA